MVSRRYFCLAERESIPGVDIAGPTPGVGGVTHFVVAAAPAQPVHAWLLPRSQPLSCQAEAQSHTPARGPYLQMLFTIFRGRVIALHGIILRALSDHLRRRRHHQAGW